MISNNFLSSVSLLRQYLAPFKRRVALLSLLLLGSIGFQLFAPQVVRRFLDQAQRGETSRVLLGTAVLFFLLTIGQKAISLYNTYLSEDLGWAATNRLRADLTAHCLRLDMGFHKLRTPGELIERIDGDVSSLAEYFSSLVVQMLGNGLLLLGVLVFIFIESWPFGLIGLMYAVLVLGVQRLIQPPMVQVQKEIRQGYADMSGFLGERLAGTEDICANGGEAYVMNRLYPIMARITAVRLRADWLGGFSFISSHMLYIFTLAATLALAGTAHQRGQMTIGTVYLMVFYIGLLESPLKYIRRQLEGLQRAVASIGRINEFFKYEAQVKETAVAGLTSAAPTVMFDGVSFAYKDRNQLTVNGNRLTVNGNRLTVNDNQLTVNDNPITDHRSPITNQTVISNVTFELASGKVLGVLGRTGSGKTTLTRLLFRLYDVDAGEIRLDGVNVRDVALSELRRQVGMVTQEVQLFEATIRDNLTLFRNYDPNEIPVSDDQIIAAIETLGLKDWFHALPDGLNTMLKSGGKGLSAGEAQLLAFTRVFLRDPRLIVLDEASSRLDPATEQLLERAIERLLRNRTAIIIAHRLATVQRADDILILGNGRVVEQGPRLQLAANHDSRFYHLLQTGLEEVLA